MFVQLQSRRPTHNIVQPHAVRATDEFDYDDMSIDSDDEDMSVSAPFKTWEVEYIRVVLMPPARERAVEKMKKCVLGSKAKQLLVDPIALANRVLSAFATMESEFKKKRLWSKKLNLLFGFTLAIQKYDAWVEVNVEGQMNGMLDTLVEHWERTMNRSAADLGIDEEFTLPALTYFLRQFQDKFVY